MMTYEQMIEEINKDKRKWYNRYFMNHFWTLYYKITDLYFIVKWGFQRMFRGYDDSARWNLDEYLARIISPVLKYVVKNGAGYPSGLTEEEWDKIRLQIAQACDDMLNDKDTYEEQRIAFELLGKHFQSLWD